MSEKAEKAIRKEAKPTNGELYVGMEAIAKLLAFDFWVSDSIKLRKLKQQLLEPHRLIAEVRDKLIQKYGEEIPLGSGNFVITGPNNPAGKPMSKGYLDFLEENAILMLMKADVKFDKIKLQAVVDRKHITLSSNDLEKLDKFVEIS